MRFKYFIQEARRNPEKNPKISLVQALEPYKDKPDYFISFTDGHFSKGEKDYEGSRSPALPKLGINPKTNYDTPAGIYAYPLKEIWKNVVTDTIPTFDDRQYIQLFRCANPKLQEISEITESQLKQTELKLWELYKDQIKFKLTRFFDQNTHTSDKDIIDTKNKIKNAFDTILKSNTTDYKDINVFWASAKELCVTFKPTSNISSVKMKTWFTNIAKGIEKLFYNVQIDFDSYNTMTTDEVDVYYKVSITVDGDNLKNSWENFIKDCYKHARIKTPGGKFWNLTRLTADLITMQKYKNRNAIGDMSGFTKLGTENTWTWAHVLRALGYIGFTDRTGKGYIHPSEPTQAMFLSKQYITHVDTILNKRYIKQDLDPKKYNKTPENLKETWDDNFTKNYINSLKDLYDSAMFNEMINYDTFYNIMSNLNDDNQHYDAGNFNGGFNNPSSIITKLNKIFTPSFVEMLLQYNDYSGADVWNWAQKFRKKQNYAGPVGTVITLAILDLLASGSLEKALTLKQKWELYLAMYNNTSNKEYKALQKNDTLDTIIDRFIKTGKEKMNFFNNYNQEKMKKLIKNITKLLAINSTVTLHLAGDNSIPF